jgi:tetratricopeptide (TPR) repeat protein
MGICLHAMGQAATTLGDRVRALDFLERSVALLRETGDQWELSWPLRDLAARATEDGDLARWRELEDEKNAYLLDVGGLSVLIGNLSEQAWLAAAQGDYARAREIALRMIELHPNQLNATALARLGEVEYLQGHPAEARRYFESGYAGFAVRPQIDAAFGKQRWQFGQPAIIP